MIKFNSLKNKILYDVNYIKDYNKNKKKFIYFEYSLAEIAVHNHIQSYKIDKIFQNKVLYLYKNKNIFIDFLYDDEKKNLFFFKYQEFKEDHISFFEKFLEEQIDDEEYNDLDYNIQASSILSMYSEIHDKNKVNYEILKFFNNNSIKHFKFNINLIIKLYFFKDLKFIKKYLVKYCQNNIIKKEIKNIKEKNIFNKNLIEKSIQDARISMEYYKKKKYKYGIRIAKKNRNRYAILFKKRSFFKKFLRKLKKKKKSKKIIFKKLRLRGKRSKKKRLKKLKQKQKKRFENKQNPILIDSGSVDTQDRVEFKVYKNYQIEQDLDYIQEIQTNKKKLTKDSVTQLITEFYYFLLYKKIKFDYYLHGENFGIFRYNLTSFLITASTVNLKHKFINYIIKKKSITNFLKYKVQFKVLNILSEKYNIINKYYYFLYLNSNLLFNNGFDVGLFKNKEAQYYQPTYTSLLTSDSISVKQTNDHNFKYFGLFLFYKIKKDKILYII